MIKQDILVCCSFTWTIESPWCSQYNCNWTLIKKCASYQLQSSCYVICNFLRENKLRNITYVLFSNMYIHPSLLWRWFVHTLYRCGIFLSLCAKYSLYLLIWSVMFVDLYIWNCHWLNDVQLSTWACYSIYQYIISFLFLNRYPHL